MNYELKPYKNTEQTKNIKISAEVLRLGTGLAVGFSIKGDWINIKLEQSNFGERKNELWKTTCFEVFLSKDKNPETSYFEVNLSSARDWNVYSLSSYRENLKELIQGYVEDIEIRRNDKAFEIQFVIKGIDLSLIQYAGITAVIDFNDGEKSYWALAHNSDKPDFHIKSSFLGLIK